MSRSKGVWGIHIPHERFLLVVAGAGRGAHRDWIWRARMIALHHLSQVWSVSVGLTLKSVGVLVFNGSRRTPDALRNVG